MSDLPPDEPLSPSEQRLAALLGLLRSDIVRSRPALVGAIMRQVRWQHLVRDVLGAVGAFASSVGRGLTFLLGQPGSRR